ncbi:hypothetical protein JCM9957A_37910 [Kineosporia succinea]
MASSRQLTRLPALECTLTAPRPSVSSWCPATVTFAAFTALLEDDVVAAAVPVALLRPTAKLVPAAAREPVRAIPAATATVRRLLV